MIGTSSEIAQLLKRLEIVENFMIGRRLDTLEEAIKDLQLTLMEEQAKLASWMSDGS